MKTETIKEKIETAALIADAISEISFCIRSSGADLEYYSRKSSVFFGIEQLSNLISRELDELYELADKNQ